MAVIRLYRIDMTEEEGGGSHVVRGVLMQSAQGRHRSSAQHWAANIHATRTVLHWRRFDHKELATLVAIAINHPDTCRCYACTRINAIDLVEECKHS